MIDYFPCRRSPPDHQSLSLSVLVSPSLNTPQEAPLTTSLLAILSFTFTGFDRQETSTRIQGFPSPLVPSFTANRRGAGSGFACLGCLGSCVCVCCALLFPGCNCVVSLSGVDIINTCPDPLFSPPPLFFVSPVFRYISYPRVMLGHGLNGGF